MTMRMSRADAIVAEGTSNSDAAFDCLGTTLQPLPAGRYTVRVLVGDEVLAEGAFEVSPTAE